MSRFFLTCIIGLTLPIAGCAKTTPETHTTPQIEIAEVESITEGISKVQLDRLFEIQWRSDFESTLKYPGNKNLDQEDIKTRAWLFCIQNEVITFFKDTGIAWVQRNDQILIDLPYKSVEFARRIKVIDNDHYAFLNENTDGDDWWLVFKTDEVK